MTFQEWIEAFADKYLEGVYGSEAEGFLCIVLDSPPTVAFPEAEVVALCGQVVDEQGLGLLQQTNHVDALQIRISFWQKLIHE